MNTSSHSIIRLRSGDTDKLVAQHLQTHGPALRARIILKLAGGERPVNVHRALGISEKTIFKWLKRWHEQGIDGLLDAFRSGRSTVLEPETGKTVLKMTGD